MLSPENRRLIERLTARKADPFETRAYTAREMEVMLNAARDQGREQMRVPGVHDPVVF